MTTYNYFIEMQDMCFRISQACKAMNKRGTQDVYAACEKGFYEMAKELTCEEAGSAINPDQIDTFICTQNFCIEQEKAAGGAIAEYIMAREKELPNANQSAEDFMAEAVHNKAFMDAISEKSEN